MTRGPGLIGALLVGVSTAKALAAARGLPLAPVDHLHGHVVANTLGAGPDRAAVPLPGRQRRPHVPRARSTTPRSYTRARLDARRRRRRGVRQGRAAARPRLSGRPASSTGWRASGDPEAFDFPPLAARRRARLQLQRAEDGAALHACATSASDEARDRRADLAASYQRAIVDALVARTRQALERERARAAGDRRRRGGQLRAARARGRAARRAGRAAVGAAARALHRQRGDDRGGRALPRADPVPGVPRRSTPRRRRRARDADASPSTASRAATCATRRARRIERVRARVRLRARGGRRDARSRAATATTASGSRWSRWTARSASSTASTRRRCARSPR